MSVDVALMTSWHMNTGRQGKLWHSRYEKLTSDLSCDNSLSSSARQICRCSPIEMWEQTVCPLRQPDKARFVALKSLKTSPSSLTRWLWEVNIWTHWDWAPRRHKLWAGQPGGELESGTLYYASFIIMSQHLSTWRWVKILTTGEY